MKRCMLVLLLLSGCVQAKPLRLCQESVQEDPFLKEFTINNRQVFGNHAAIVSHALLRLGIEFSIARLPWRRCLQEAGNGKFDGVIGLGWSKERSQQFAFPLTDGNDIDESLRLYYVNYPIYASADSPLQWDGAHFSAVRHGLTAPKGYLVEELLRRHGVLQQLDVGIDAGVQLLANGRLDGVVLSEEVGDRMLAQQHIKGVRKLSPYFYRQPIFLAINRRQQVLPGTVLPLLWRQLPLSRAAVLQHTDL